MNDATYMALLAEVTANVKALITAKHPDASALLHDALKLLGKSDRQMRRLARKAKAAEVIGKTSK